MAVTLISIDVNLKGEILVIKVVAKNIIKADKVDEFIAVAKNLVHETVQNDKGCIHYELYQDVSNSQILTIIEEWENKVALEQHMAAKHFIEATALMKNFVEKPGDANLYLKLA